MSTQHSQGQMAWWWSSNDPCIRGQRQTPLSGQEHRLGSCNSHRLFSQPETRSSQLGNLHTRRQRACRPRALCHRSKHPDSRDPRAWTALLAAADIVRLSPRGPGAETGPGPRPELEPELTVRGTKWALVYSNPNRRPSLLRYGWTCKFLCENSNRNP